MYGPFYKLSNLFQSTYIHISISIEKAFSHIKPERARYI